MTTNAAIDAAHEEDASPFPAASTYIDLMMFSPMLTNIPTFQMHLTFLI